MTTFDPANKSAFITASGGDLTATSDAVQVNAPARIRSTTSKGDHRYTETLIGSVNAAEQLVGVCNSSLSMGGYGQYDANLTAISTNSGAVYVNGSYAGAGPTFGAGDIVSQEIDPAQGVRWRVNGGTWSSWFALPSGTDWYQLAMLTPLSAAQASQTANFGGSAFTYSLPSGAVGWDAAGGTSYTLTAAVGAFALSGQSANLLRGYLHTAAVGAFTLTGQAANLVRGYVVAAGVGAFTLTGQAALFPVGRKVAAGVGTFTLSGQAAALKQSLTITASLGVFALSGQSAAFALGKGLTADPGAFTLSGQDASLRVAKTFPAEAGAFVLTGQDATLTLVVGSGSRTLTAEAGAFSLTGMAATLILGRPVIYGPPRNDNRTIYGAARSDDLTITGPARNNSIVIAA